MKRVSQTFFPLVIIFSILFISGCAGTKVSPNLVNLEVNFTWTPANRCSPTSPEINVVGIPSSTQKLKVNMTDLDKPSYNHGGGTVTYEGSSVIPTGALKSFRGPCPPSGQHAYQIKVKAIDASGTIVGLGKRTQLF